MRLYDCKVLLAGSRENEVRKTDVTAAEIMVLRDIHGADSVSEIKPKGMDKRPHADERRRLFMLYVGSEENESMGGHYKEKAAMLQRLFGPSHVELPIELKDDASFLPPDEPVPQRVKVQPKAGKAEDVAAAALA